MVFVVITDKWCAVCVLTAPSRVTQDDKVIRCSSALFLRDSFSSWYWCGCWAALPLRSHPLWVSGFFIMHADFYLSFTSGVLCMVSYFPQLCRKCRAFQSNWNLLGLLLCISECHSAAVYVPQPLVSTTCFVVAYQTIDQFQKYSRHKTLI